jgi:hypothetical protein
MRSYCAGEVVMFAPFLFAVRWIASRWGTSEAAGCLHTSREEPRLPQGNGSGSLRVEAAASVSRLGMQGGLK